MKRIAYLLSSAMSALATLGSGNASQPASTLDGLDPLAKSTEQVGTSTSVAISEAARAKIGSLASEVPERLAQVTWDQTCNASGTICGKFLQGSPLPGFREAPRLMVRTVGEKKVRVDPKGAHISN
jgi:hypothetical protein